MRSKAGRKCNFGISLAAVLAFLAIATATLANPQVAILESFESGTAASAVAVTPANSSAQEESNTAVGVVSDGGSQVLQITDPDGATNGACLTLTGAIPAPGYYLITADVKVDNASAPIASFGMAAVAGESSTARISDSNAGYVMNLAGSADAGLGYQTIGAAVQVAADGSFPKNLTLYFGTNVSGNDFNSPDDGKFVGAHRTQADTWAAGSTNAVYVDNIRRYGPGNAGEERHMWISVGDGFTDLTKLENYLVQAKANNFNCVDILARYRADAYYIPNRTDKTYVNAEPLGTRIGGKAVTVDNDPLQYALDRGHELGLKVYVAFSCFLVTPNSTWPSTIPSDAIMWFYNSGSPRPMLTTDSSAEGLWADVGRADVRDYTKNVLMDLVSNYDFDGVMFDRIRYPTWYYSYNPQSLAELGISGTPYYRDAAFNEARREAVTTFVHDCYEAVTAKKPWLVIGSTPIAYGSGMGDTYNAVFQSLPKWMSKKTANRRVDFGCQDLVQPQFYRLWNSAAPYQAPDANTLLMMKGLFGDVVNYSKDFGMAPGCYTNVAPLLYHPNSADVNQSNANSENMLDARQLGDNGFGIFAASKTLADVNLIRATTANSAGIDILGDQPSFTDYLMKAGWDSQKPNAVNNFNVVANPDGSVTMTWQPPDLASDGDTAAGYLIYKSATSPVKPYWANLLTKKALSWDTLSYTIPAGYAGTFSFKIVPVDDYNNKGSATEIGPIEVGGQTPPPPDIIVDNLNAAVIGSWSSGSSSGDKYATDYRFAYKGDGSTQVIFSATIQTGGNYDVYEWHPQGTNRATDAQHLVASDSGVATVLVNQTINGGKWNKIATGQMTAGQTYTVTITNAFVTNSVVMADAIKWVYVPPIPPTPPPPGDVIVDNPNAIKIGTWTTGTSAADKYGANYYSRGKGTGSNKVVFTCPVTADGKYDVFEWHPAGTNRPVDARHMITNADGTATVLVDQTVNGGKWNKIGTYILRAGNDYTVTIDDVFAVSGKQVMADAIKWSFVEPLESDTPADVVVDNPAAVRTGSWTVGTSAADKYGTNYYSRSKGTGANYCSFTGNIVTGGVYDVYEWHCAGGNRAKDAQLTFSSLAGNQTVIVNQQVNGGKWNKIGTVQLKDGQASVVISDIFTIGDIVIADAVKWVYVSPLPDIPQTPMDLVGIAVEQTEAMLFWFDLATNETEYVVERDGVPIAILPANSEYFEDSGLSADTEYQYAVRASIGGVKSCLSNVESVKTLPYPPTAPSDLAVVGISGTEAGLSWVDNADNEAGFEIVRNGEPIAVVAADSVSYIDNAISECTEFTYTVRAFNAGGKSADSNAQSVTVDFTKPTIAAPADVTVSTDAGVCQASGVELGAPEVADNCGVASTANDAPAIFPKGETIVTWTVTDIHGNTATAAQKVTVVDTEKPVIQVPADVQLDNSVEPTIPATYEPTATDNCGDVTVVCDPPSGSGFAAGETVVTVTATDAAGNVETATFKVVRKALDFAGFLPPIGGCVELGNGGSFATPVRSFKVNSTIPVKMILASQGATVVTGIHTLQVVKYSDATTAQDPIDATPTDAATAGNQFRLTGSEWHFNLKTKGLTPGIYLLVAKMSDGSQKSVWVEMR